MFFYVLLVVGSPWLVLGFAAARTVQADAHRTLFFALVKYITTATATTGDKVNTLPSMSHFITLRPNEALAKLETYKHQFPQKTVPRPFEFSEQVALDLDKLALIALHPDSTLAIYYAYEPIFLDLMARWVQNTAWFETNYTEVHGTASSAPGSIVLLALSRIIDLAPESTNLIEYYFDSSNDILSSLFDPSLTPSELQASLLAYYRIYHSNPHIFKRFIDPKNLHKIIHLESEDYNPAKILSIRILSSYISASESAHESMLETHVRGSFHGTYDGGYSIGYRFVPLVEAKRLSNHTKLPPAVSYPDGKPIQISQAELSPLITCVCGVLLFNRSSDKVTNSDSTFVPVEGSVTVLKQLATHILRDRPVMLHGPPGSGKTFLINQMASYMNCSDSIVKIHLGEQTDAKLLLGTYTSGEKPGSFQWRSGVLTTAVREGKWVLVEDIDKAPTEVLSILLVLLEKRELNIPSRGEVIKAHSGFQLISTITTSSEQHSRLPDLIGMRLWELCEVPPLPETDLKFILAAKFPLLEKFIAKFIMLYDKVVQIFSMPAFISLNKGSHPRSNSSRDLMKFCSRCNKLLQNKGVTNDDTLFETLVYEDIFAEAVECFGSAITEPSASVPLMNAIGEILEIPATRVNLFIENYVPSMHIDDDSIQIGRALLHKSSFDKALYPRKKGGESSFARTKHLKRLMEQIALAIQMVEPVLLVGETGTGKTTVVQEVAKMMNKKLTAINVSQQTEASDLLGGFKPVNTMTVAVPLQESFENLFLATFSQKKNAKFSELLSKCFNKRQWKNVIKLWKEAVKMARVTLDKSDDSGDEKTQDGGPKKKRKLSSTEKLAMLEKWVNFLNGVEKFEAQAANLESSFVFNFVEGSLVKAVRNGEWLLLDEINLASSDTLESIADLLTEASEQRSILLSERGDVEAIKAHPDFRIFGCMNPSTDVGKRDLPVSIRSRFSEIYVHSPDRDREDLLLIIDKYIDKYAVGDDWISEDIAELYLEAKLLAEKNKIVDGANQKPHFSIRTLTRTLTYVRDIVMTYGLRRSLYEGFCMSFLTLLDVKSEALLRPIIEQYTVGKSKNPRGALSHIPKAPSDANHQYVQFRHYWLQKGAFDVDEQPNYIITPFVEKNLLNLVRATASRRFPVLVQGPTSAGKTSMISYLAAISGHKFVRINNHEHTDLQEYLGTYISDSSGKLVFREGILVEALRNGYWIVLDELNLAPTDVLEALNRLLDDNRELFIPETQEIVHPHPDFMLFATQNPPGLYGGRKVLSRAFRNRFLELHFDDIPRDELEIILRDRCRIAPSYGKKIVEVYNELSLQRQSSRLFEQKNSFATLRDLFRWALREAVGYEELAANGYMLLAERVRNEEEKQVVKQTIEKVMRVKLDMDAYYEKLENKEIFNLELPIVWTKAMRRLAVLVSTSIKYKEPLLLVGETGCGKTTVCQILALFMGKQLITVNAHQNTETGDILGAQRPLRNRFETRGELVKNLVAFFETLGIDVELKEANAEGLTTKYRKTVSSLSDEDKAKVGETLIADIEANIKAAGVLFEWVDGPLVQAMKTGDFFLLDEISLADDSVLERLNSVLEPERSLLLAEKGTEDAFLVAQDDFLFLATMNPGGDYGKKELSPALRNRFTEIWVPSMDDFNDVRHIVKARLNSQHEWLADPLTDFSEWFGRKLGNGNVNSGVISLRDILAWVEFINSCSESISSDAAFYHGASMVFIDALGTNNTAYLAENETKLTGYKTECVEKLSLAIKKDVSQYSLINNHEVIVEEASLKAGLFEIARVPETTFNDPFNLHAPTTAANALRVVRAMQVKKPVLLEGSPGVGKTSLVSAIAKATGNELIRINLSEQTDLIDLFGSDAPVEGGQTGEFVWRDAPFLRAMKNGEWVLLDEMNLASQSVLEGLNACLDHRGEAYIPELDRSFPRHPDFKVFAAQNPQYQGGGRKGLPKSFVNRFTVVFVDTLSADDLTLISHKLYPNISRDDCSKLITFISKLEEQVVHEKSFGNFGGPWEFNLRDVLRWLSSFNSLKNINNEKDMQLGEFLDMIVCQRFRTPEDRFKVRELFISVFGIQSDRTPFYSIGLDYVQAGGALIKRNDITQFNDSSDRINLAPLQCNFPVLESAFRSVNENIPFIITGPSNAGKTELIRFMALAAGVKLSEFAMNSDVDSMDILGGYEQVDVTRAMSEVTAKTYSYFREFVIQDSLAVLKNAKAALLAMDLLYVIEKTTLIADSFPEISRCFRNFVSQYHNETLDDLLKMFEEVEKKANEKTAVRFEWFDGLLVKAVSNGDWLVLDNANLCNPSVLDRLNSLLEVNGSLIINECSTEDGLPRVLTPHPNFRLFLTVNPKYGELSRAMRNRCIEVHIDDLQYRSTTFDKLTLGVPPVQDTMADGDICDMMDKLKFGETGAGKPLASFIPCNESKVRRFATTTDAFDLYKQNLAKSSLVSILAQLDIQFVETWAQTVFSCKEFEFVFKTTIENSVEVLKVLSSADYLSSCQKTYNNVDESRVSARFLETQTLNPIINEVIVPYLSQNGEVNWLEPTLLFQVASNIFDMTDVLLNIEKKGSEGQLQHLSFLELSAAVNFGREMKRMPKVNVYGFVKELHNWIVKVFLTHATASVDYNELVFSTILELQGIWHCLVASAQVQNVTKLRVYHNMVNAWFEKHKDISMLIDQKKPITSLSLELELTTGFSMGTIWNHFRQNYPSSNEAWEYFSSYLDILREFDDLVAQYEMNAEEISVLRQLMIDLHGTIINASASDNELAELFKQLVSGIASLKEAAKGSAKRHNDFEPEFTMLSNLVESSSVVSGADTLATQLKLHQKSDKLTLGLVFSQSSDIFKPYPRIFDDLWLKNQDDGVKGLFGEVLFETANQKSHGLDKCLGKFLDQQLVDMKLLASSLIENSSAVLQDQKEVFLKLLIDWMHQILAAHGIELPQASDSFNEEIISTTMKSVKEAGEDALLKVFEVYIGPALLLAFSTASLKSLGKAWVLFSCGCIQLFVPSSPLDPAIDDHVAYDIYKAQNESLDVLIESWKAVRQTIAGDEPLATELTIPHLRNADREMPKIFRPNDGIDELFEEWSSFMSSSIDEEAVKRLLSRADAEYTEASANSINVFQHNSSNFLTRLRASKLVYSDLNDILAGYVYGLKFGLNLMTMENENSLAKLPLSELWSVEISNLLNPSQVKATFDEFKLASKSFGNSSNASEKLMLFFISLCFLQNHKSSGSELDYVTNLAFQTLYYRWFYRRAKEEELAAQEASLYKYEGDDDNVEKDFQELFPDYEEVMEVDSNLSKNTTAFSDLYPALCQLYVDYYLHGKRSDVFGVVQQGAKLASDLSKFDNLFAHGSTSSSSLAAVLTNMLKIHTTYSIDKGDDVDFYHGESPFQFRRAMRVVNNVHSSVSSLLDQWPEHATLQNISRTAQEFTEFPSNYPVSRLLQKVEVIFTYINEWEKFASSKVTLKACYDELTELIVSWRKLELSSWKKLFDNEDSTFKERIGKWWFYLFETIIVPIVLADENDEQKMSPIQLLGALNVFMSETTYGEFVPRLELVEAFRKHALTLEGGETTANALGNFTKFYQQYVPLIGEAIEQSKKTLEKDINEVILLASWKDVNIDALKQSSRRSHSSLFKIVRKYRSLLATPISPLVQAGFSSESKVLTEQPIHIATVGELTQDHSTRLAIQKLCGKAATWDERPNRLKNLSMIENNMRIFIEKVNRAAAPSLYEYAKEIIEEMDRLKKETPNVMNDETKKTVAALRTQKHKLLSEVLKELRRIGIKTTVKPDIKKLLATVNLIFTNSAAFGSKHLAGSDSYFMRILDLLPRLRASVAEGNEEVPQADLERGMAATENLLFSLVTTRKPIANLNQSLESLGALNTAIADKLSAFNQSSSVMCKSSSVDVFFSSLKKLGRFVSSFDQLLDYVFEVLDSAAFFGQEVKSDIFTELRREVGQWKSKLSINELTIPSEDELLMLNEFKTFIDRVVDELIYWRSSNPNNAFIADTLLTWLKDRKTYTNVDSITSADGAATVEQLEKSLRKLSNSILVSVQKAVELHADEITMDDDSWLQTTQQRVSQAIKVLHHESIVSLLEDTRNVVLNIEHNEETSAISAALMSFTLPLTQLYHKLAACVFDRARENYVQVSRSTYVMATALYTLSSSGFCSPEPPQEQKKDDNLQEGTGLGDGEGATNNSKDADEDDDLDEHAQKPNEENDKDKDEGEDEDDEAVDIEGDMAGDLENASDQEKDDNEDGEEEEELDEEIDDLDDLDPNAVDEKMWDEEAKDDSKEKESDKMPQKSSADDDNLEAMEDEEQKDQEGENEDGDENDKENDGESGDEEEDVGEQEDEVKNEENEQLDDHVPETETLDLPEDINLDDENDEEGQDEDEGDEKFEDGLDEEEKPEENAPEDKEEEPANAESGDEDEDDAMDEDENANEEEEEGTAGDDKEVDEDPQNEESDEETVNAPEEDEEENKEEEQDSAEKGEQEADGLDGADQEQNEEEDVDMDAASKAAMGEKGDGADNEVMEDQDDVGASGTASSEMQQNEEKDQDTNDNSNSEVKESLKQLGDSLKEFHRRRQEIKEASQQEQEEPEAKADVRPDEFQHVEGENTEQDTQALGSADNQDQIQRIDEDKAIDDDEEQLPKQEEEKQEEKNAADDMDIEDGDKEEAQDGEQGDQEAETENLGAFVGERRTVKEEDQTIDLDRDELEDTKAEVDMKHQVNDDYELGGDEIPALGLFEAREAWNRSELATQELSSGLCEQLRLILEPTLATKLRGDYKTGKRLNMKRIIPYIASEFRKDKIWLRRTKPSKRQYQIMISVDNSKSMSESKVTELTLHSIALVSKALTQLESGGLSIVRFGEDVKLLHPFDRPFNQETGARVFQWLDFQQERTDIKQLCSKSLKIFENARATSNADLWQLQIIISDGVCEDHETVERMVRQAREEKVMLVFVVIDGITSNESILDMSQVSYVPDANTGAMSLKVNKYLDTFPFEFYVVVRSINELPEMLALILRQYFTEIANV